MFPDPDAGGNETFSSHGWKSYEIVDTLKKMSMILTLRIKDRNIIKDMYLKKIQENFEPSNMDSVPIFALT